MTSNLEWAGRVGDVWAREWQRTDRSFAGLTPHLIGAALALAPEKGKAIDLGCGAGETTIALASARPKLEVAGVDLSADLITIARWRGAGHANLTFRVGDTAALKPASAVDLFLSRHGVMFFDDPVAALSAIRRAGTPDARLVFSCFRDPGLNPWSHLLDDPGAPAPAASPVYAPGPFGFADRDLTAGILTRAGWVDAEAVPVDYTYIAGAGDNPVDDARLFFSHIGPAARALADVAPDQRAVLFDRLDTALAAHESEGQIKFPAAAWIWTARAGDTA
ncbi:MAG: class I SAM-dependent methyltransferase [Sphingomonas sp.]|uniref:class I SAM-dependent methyltransferase n=1 Tax=Sphingomonas sp. TaxID=28214 RepID=UPI0011FB5390|nr:class I SAM-dependent methyltransferase [Sphingomonas sp.]THD36566.1 MAG: class I SAM-dependent methyltransferase [Sphingomonas sp.]